MKQNHKKIKIKWMNIVLCLLFLIFTIILITSSINIIKWIIDSKNSNVEITKIINITEIKKVEDNENTEITVDEETINKSDPYWDYIKMSLINVDFKNLKEQNDSTIGWIQVNSTNINYPFVQASDNDFYLNHSFNKKYNNAGWVFMDYRNNKNNFDKNTILYAHGRVDKTMFGSLKDTLSSKWLDNSNNHVVKLSTEYENTLWQVFSVYKIPTTNDYLQINFNNNESFLKFVNMLKERSIYKFNTTLSENDRILTLSTCYNDTDKVVLHAKLIKREKR